MGLKYSYCNIDGQLTRLDWDIVVGSTPYYGYHFTPNYDKLPMGVDFDEWFICRRDCPEDEITKNLVTTSRDKIGVRWKVEIADTLRVESKWDDLDLRRGCALKIYRNNELFYEDGCGSRQRGYRVAEDLIESWQCHVLDIGTIDFDKKMVGRKIWYRGEPAIIDRFCWGSGDIYIIPDKDASCEKFSRPREYQKDIDDGMYDYWSEYENGLREPLTSHNINWFRN